MKNKINKIEVYFILWALAVGDVLAAFDVVIAVIDDNVVVDVVAVVVASFVAAVAVVVVSVVVVAVGVSIRVLHVQLFPEQFSNLPISSCSQVVPMQSKAGGSRLSLQSWIGLRPVIEGPSFNGPS